jgi:hypothetical protein
VNETSAPGGRPPARSAANARYEHGKRRHVAGLRGTTGVLLAYDIDEAKREGLLGFAIERTGGNRPHRWLEGLLNFPGLEHKAGDPVASNVGPIQKFRWSDYTVWPGTDYTYTVHPVYGHPGEPEVEAGVKLTVRTSATDTGEHRVIFNRAAAASQAFSRDFNELAAKMTAAKGAAKADISLPADAAAWLSRGALEQIVGFINRALDPSWALDVAIYEYELKAIRDALDAARKRGVNVRIVYHAKPRDEQTTINEANLARWPAAIKRARVTQNICHDKFIVLSRIVDEGGHRSQFSAARPTSPRTVSIGRPTSFMSQSSPTSPRATCRSSAFSSGELRRRIHASGSMRTILFRPMSSCRLASRREAVRPTSDCSSTRSKGRTRMCSSAPPSTSGGDPRRPAWRGQRRRVTPECRTHAAGSPGFTATAPPISAAAFLNQGLEGFLKESTASGGNILIHTKLIVLSFTTDTPTVISGSHNFSHNARSATTRTI